MIAVMQKLPKLPTCYTNYHLSVIISAVAPFSRANHWHGWCFSNKMFSFDFGEFRTCESDGFLLNPFPTVKLFFLMRQFQRFVAAGRCLTSRSCPQSCDPTRPPAVYFCVRWFVPFLAPDHRIAPLLFAGEGGFSTEAESWLLECNRKPPGGRWT